MLLLSSPTAEDLMVFAFKQIPLIAKGVRNPLRVVNMAVLSVKYQRASLVVV